MSFTLCEMHKVYRGAEGQEGGSRALNEAGRGGQETVQVGGLTGGVQGRRGYCLYQYFSLLPFYSSVNLWNC